MTRALFRPPPAPPGDATSRCPACSAQHPGNALRCQFCHAWLAPTARCGRCDGVFFTRIERCSSCGGNLSEVHSLSPALSLPPRRSWSTQRRVLAAVAIALIVSLLVVGFVTNHLTIWDSEGGIFGILMLVLCLAGGIALLSWNVNAGLYHTDVRTDRRDETGPGPWTGGSGPF